MKNKFYILLCFLFVVITDVLASIGETKYIDGVYYTLDFNSNEYYAIVDASWTDIKVANILEKVDFDYNKNVPVKVITYRAFVGRTSLTSVTLPNSIESIGSGAFKNCSSLESINIPDSITKIYKETFSYCKSLKSIILSDNLTSIGEWAFYGCESLKSIILGNNVTSIEGGAFELCSSLESINIPNSVYEIPRNAFRGCRSLKTIILGDNITFIGEEAFYGCKSLAEFIIPQSVSKIGCRAFAYCGLTSITIPESVNKIDVAVFLGCDSLRKVQWNAIEALNIGYSYGGYIEDTGVLKAENIVDITFGNKVQTIPVSLCLGLEKLTNITISNSVTSIGGYAFYNCSSLESINIPNSVYVIPMYAFSKCESLKSIILGDNVTSIGEGAFSYCSPMESITLPATIRSIECEFPENLDTIICFSNRRPYICEQPRALYKECVVFVPKGSYLEYKDLNSSWYEFKNILELKGKEYTITINVNDEKMGSVKGGGIYEETSKIVITAIPNKGYHFVQWSDGNIENPRTIVVNEDIELTAIFEKSSTPVNNLKDDNIVIYTKEGLLYVEGAETDYYVLDAAGRLVYSGRESALSLPRGVYVVNVGGEVQKVVI